MSAPARRGRAPVAARISSVASLATFAVFDDAAVAVVGVFAEADIGDDDEVELGFADGFDGALNDAFLLAASLCRRVFRFGETEENDAGDAKGFDFAQSSRILSADCWKTPGMERLPGGCCFRGRRKSG